MFTGTSVWSKYFRNKKATQPKIPNWCSIVSSHVNFVSKLELQKFTYFNQTTKTEAAKVFF